jgi:hypothetical protein
VHELRSKVPEPLLADARAKVPQLPLAALVRYALAKLAGWPDSAARAIAGDSGKVEAA